MTGFRTVPFNAAAYRHFGTTAANKKVRFTRFRTPETQAAYISILSLSIRYSNTT